MKKLILLFFIFSVFTGLIYSQSALQIANDRSPFVKGTEGLIGPQCVGGLVYDDNTFENGYGWGPNFGIGKWVMLMTPTSYPFTINQVCLALTRYPTQPSLSFTFDIEIYDQTGTGGSPGNLLASVPNQTVTVVPTWPQVEWYDFTNLTGIPAITSGSVYVGISFDPQPVENRQKYIGGDESATTTQRPGYGYIQSAWAPITNYFSQYKAIGVRVDGTGQTYAHNIATGPFLGLPAYFNTNLQKQVKARIANTGTSNESNFPVKFFIQGTQVNSISMSLNAGAVDSVTFNWVPADTGFINIKIVSALATDQNRGNDTVSTNVRVYPPGYFLTCWGTGSTSVGYPFYTFYMDSRTDMLYLANEIGSSPATIMRIGFDVISAAPQVMNGFKIRMQNTTASTISGFGTGMTEVYSGAFTMPGTGMQFITLTTPFTYTGGNLLIEICFNNSSYTSNSTVKSTAVTGRVYHAHNDLTTGDGCNDITTGALQTTLPNICFIPQMIGIIRKPESIVPDEFSLSQNYPNPFNPNTIISYQLPIDNYAKLTIFDALGKEVAVLVNEKQNAGNYSVVWDGTNYSSGLYFYKLECEGFSDVKKMALIK